MRRMRLIKRERKLDGVFVLRSKKEVCRVIFSCVDGGIHINNAAGKARMMKSFVTLKGNC